MFKSCPPGFLQKNFDFEKKYEKNRTCTCGNMTTMHCTTFELVCRHGGVGGGRGWGEESGEESGEKRAGKRAGKRAS
jgi:hypothetical protein